MKTTENNTFFTRKQYMDKECTHGQYYEQFATTGIMALTGQYFRRADLVEAVRSGQDLNTIELKKWDALGRVFLNHSLGLTTMMKERGDSLTQAALVCIGKAAARKIVNELTHCKYGLKRPCDKAVRR